MRSSLSWFAALLVACASGGASPAHTQADPAREAVRLYDAGRYAEARALLEQLDAEGKLDGPLLYRLAFCLRQAGDGARERQVLERAVTALREAAPADPTLESVFYLENALRNLGHMQEAHRVATETIQAVEAGGRQINAEDPLECFRLAKLYGDLGRDDEAARWYERAVEALDPATHPAYVAWARRFLARRALARGDYLDAERHLRVFLEKEGFATQRELDQLAVVLVRTGKYAEARKAWRMGEKLNPADANRERYCWHLADLADRLGTLPEKAPDGRAWTALSKEELEGLMQQQAARVREIQGRARTEPASEQQRRRWEEEIREIQGVFVAAGLEYAARGHPIRETAFFGGYAPLIFKPREWELPPPAARPEATGDPPGRR